MSPVFCSPLNGWLMTIDIPTPEHSPIRSLPLDQGSGHHQAVEGVALLGLGMFEEALAELRLAVALGDNRPSTLLNLAIAEDRVGDRDRARRLMQQVAVRLPNWDEPILRLAESLRASNEIAAAEEAYRRVLELNPNRPTALMALGGLLLARGQAAEARNLLQRCCDVVPHEAEAWGTLGYALRATGAPDLALQAYVKAQALQPGELTYVLRGVEAAVEAGQTDVELDRLSAAAENDPLSAVLLAGRSVLLDRLGYRNEAVDALEAAAILAPSSTAILGLLANRLCHTSRLTEAEDAMRRICASKPDCVELHNNHATILTRLQRHEEARLILLKMQQKHGLDAYPLCNLAIATVYVGLQDEAVAEARRAICLDPAASLPRRALCNTLPYRSGTTAMELLAALQDCAATLPRTDQRPFVNGTDPKRKLVIGLLSGSLRSHPVGWLTVAGIEMLDPEQFSVIALAQIIVAKDPFARQFRALSSDWAEVDGMTDAQLIEAARSKQIDILIDLGGYGESGRMRACANRLAPVQIKWVGMQNHSTGIPEIDWFLTDRWETPVGFERYYSERLLRLPDGYICYSPPPYAPDVVPLPALTNGHVTFGCFNNIAKITSQVIGTWATILHRVPDARLVVKAPQLSDASIKDRMLTAFASHRVDTARIELRDYSSHRAFMGQYGDIDMALDPFPYSGGLTTCEALWMGVPTITLAGEIFASRHSTSHLSNVGLADWVTSTIEDYIAMAVARAREIPALAELRAGLRERVRRSPLCDAPRFGRNLGAALRHTWQEWCAAQTVNPAAST